MAVFIVGLICYGLGFFVFDRTKVGAEIILKVADVLVIGVVLGFVSNAARFLGIFKKDLQDIIYGKEFISQRKDVYPLWETISKELFKNKFPIIHKDLLNSVNHYFPKDEVSYYNDYEVVTLIEWVDKPKGLIKVTDKVSFDLMSDTSNKIHYLMKSWTIVNEGDDYKDSIIDLTVNDEKPIPKNIKDLGSKKDKESGLCHTQEITLCGSNKYAIKYTRVKTYNINSDYYIGFKAKYIVKDLRVHLFLPEDIDATFISRGTQNEFVDVNNIKNQIEKRYKGIVLPRQGFIFALKIK